MYNIIDQSNISSGSKGSSTMLNDTAKPIITTTSTGYKIDCAKECPCGVPVIPVPDQWLEVMVTGGFKVWHIIFIIIAFLVTIVVVYCCFHRCRIPRTKQEIEADLMRSNLTNKFREYLQEFPNEPTTFLEALKRVQDLEEKSEQDDMSARKRKGWLKRMGKERQPGGAEKGAEQAKEEATLPDSELVTTTAGAAEESPPVDSTVAPEEKEAEKKPDQPEAPVDDKAKLTAATDGGEAAADRRKSKTTSKSKPSKSKAGKTEKAPQEVPLDTKSAKTKSEKLVAQATLPPAGQHDEADRSQTGASGTTVASAATGRPARARRKRDKPNLSRTKATHGGSRGESMETKDHNVLLTIPVASHHHHNQHHQHQHHSHQSTTTSHPHEPSQVPTIVSDQQAPTTTSQTRRVRSKTKEPKDSTVIQIDPSLDKSSGSKSKQKEHKNK